MKKKRTPAATFKYDPDDFLTSDGWKSWMFTATPLLPSLAAAQEAWEQCRTRTWRIWLDDLHDCRSRGRRGPDVHAPEGAIFHDEIGRAASRASYAVWSDYAKAVEAAEADIASVAEFRQRRPRAAREIVAELDAFIGQLKWFADAAERGRGDREVADRLMYGAPPAADDEGDDDD